MAVVDTVDEYLNTSYGGEAGESIPAVRKAPPRVTRIALQVGSRSSYIPSYIREIWPFAVKETSLDGAALETEEMDGNDFLIKEIEIEE
jgi:hypothetical protein